MVGLVGIGKPTSIPACHALLTDPLASGQTLELQQLAILAHYQTKGALDALMGQERAQVMGRQADAAPVAAVGQHPVGAALVVGQELLGRQLDIQHQAGHGEPPCHTRAAVCHIIYPSLPRHRGGRSATLREHARMAEGSPCRWPNVVPGASARAPTSYCWSP